MTPRDSREPERWVVSTDAPPELRALLEVARREGPSITMRTTLGTRLGLSVQQALIGVGTKSVAAVTIALAGITGAGLGMYTGQESRADMPAQVTQLEPPPAPLATDNAQIPALPTPSPAEATPSTSEPPPARTAAVKAPTEAALIRAAHDALGSNVRLAKAQLERHRRLYPEGQLAQEREVLLIEVLRLEGNAAEASARAAEFQQRNPDSAHRPAHGPVLP